VELCLSGRYTKEQVLKMIRGEGGMVAYLGTNRISEVENRIDAGDEKARFYLQAMCYQIAKDIGAMASVLKGNVDAVILTGKILESRKAVEWIKERVRFIAPVKEYHEQEALVFALAGLRILKGEDIPKEYE
jgi:butyrate kinase